MSNMDCNVTTDADSSKCHQHRLHNAANIYVLDTTAKFTSVKVTQKIINIQIEQQRRQYPSLLNSAINIKK